MSVLWEHTVTLTLTVTLTVGAPEPGPGAAPVREGHRVHPRPERRQARPRVREAVRGGAAPLGRRHLPGTFSQRFRWRSPVLPSTHDCTLLATSLPYCASKLNIFKRDNQCTDCRAATRRASTRCSSARRMARCASGTSPRSGAYASSSVRSPSLGIDREPGHSATKELRHDLLLHNAHVACTTLALTVPAPAGASEQLLLRVRRTAAGASTAEP